MQGPRKQKSVPQQTTQGGVSRLPKLKCVCGLLDIKRDSIHMAITFIIGRLLKLESLHTASINTGIRKDISGPTLLISLFLEFFWMKH